MSQRTLTLHNLLLDLTGAPVVGAPILVHLLVPGGGNTLDGDGDVVSVVDEALSTDDTGAYSLVVLYPGDLATANCTLQITENGVLTQAPTGFPYVSSKAVSDWYHPAAPAGTVKVYADLEDIAAGPIGGRGASIALNTNGIATGGIFLSARTPIAAVSDGAGRVRWALIPNSAINPVGTQYTLSIDGEPSSYTFVCPDTDPGGDGTNLTSLITPPAAITAIVIAPAMVLHDTGLTPAGDAPHPSPASLADDLENLAAAIAEAGPYTLPIASTSVLGGVKVDGSTITIDGSDVIHAAGGGGGMTNPMTAIGDLIVASMGGVPGRLAHGTDGDVFTVDPVTHLPAWRPPVSGGGGSADAAVPLLNTSGHPPATLIDGTLHNSQVTTATAFGAGHPRIAVWRQGTSAPVGLSDTGTNSGKIVAAYGDYIGATWLAPFDVAVPPGGSDYQQPGLLTTSAGTTLLTFTALDATSASAASTIHLGRSTDGGGSWSFSTLTAPYTGTGRACWSAGDLFQHSSGAIFLPIYGTDTGWGSTGGAIFVSTDDGVTWGTRIDISPNSTTGRQCFIERPDASLRCFSTGPYLYSGIATQDSTDVGATWSAQVGIPGFVDGDMIAVALLPTTNVLILALVDDSSGTPALLWSHDYGDTWKPQLLSGGTGLAAGAALYQGASNYFIFLYAEQFSSASAAITHTYWHYRVPVIDASLRGNPALAQLLAALATGGVLVNSTSLDALLPSGVAAGRPGAGTSAGDAYFATDTGVLSVWDGAAWVAIGGSYTLPAASTSVLGGVKVDGTTIDIDGSDVISAPRQITSGAESSRPAAGAAAGKTYFATDTGVLSLSDGAHWWKVATTFDLGGLALLYLPPSPSDWLGADAAIPASFGADGATLASFVDVTGTPNQYVFTTDGGGSDATVHGTVPTGPDYHLIAHYQIADDLSDVSFLRFGLSPTTNLDDGCWYHLDSSSSQAWIEGAVTGLGTPPTDAAFGSFHYLWLAVIGGVFHVRTSDDGVTFTDRFNGATTITPAYGGFRIQSGAGPQHMTFDWMQFSPVPPAGVTVI